jgi:hypothetical protein
LHTGPTPLPQTRANLSNVYQRPRGKDTNLPKHKGNRTSLQESTTCHTTAVKCHQAASTRMRRAPHSPACPAHPCEGCTGASWQLRMARHRAVLQGGGATSAACSCGLRPLPTVVLSGRALEESWSSADHSTALMNGRGLWMHTVQCPTHAPSCNLPTSLRGHNHRPPRIPAECLPLLSPLDKLHTTSCKAL